MKPNVISLYSLITQPLHLVKTQTCIGIFLNVGSLYVRKLLDLAVCENWKKYGKIKY